MIEISIVVIRILVSLNLNSSLFLVMFMIFVDYVSSMFFKFIRWLGFCKFWKLICGWWLL